MNLRTREAFEACLLGSAIGDALGAPIEFLGREGILSTYGPSGLRDYAKAYRRTGAITDDTQMTLFTAEGLIRYDNRLKGKGIASFTFVMHNAYLRWLETQGIKPQYEYPDARKGGLLRLASMRHRRAPGNTCLSALGSGKCGSLDEPINNSKGCGGVMRVAPIGLAGSHEQAFARACEAAAITHGHPSGYLSAGFYAAVIASLVAGDQLSEAIEVTKILLRQRLGHEETLRAVELAQNQAEVTPPSIDAVERLGAGWVAEEALAIALYCALAGGDFRSGVLLAVNHSGDSDSTGSLAGGLLALLDPDGIPQTWIDGLELRDTITDLAWDLFRHFGGDYVYLGPPQPMTYGIGRSPDGTEIAHVVDEDPKDWKKYPGI